MSLPASNRSVDRSIPLSKKERKLIRMALQRLTNNLEWDARQAALYGNMRFAKARAAECRELKKRFKEPR